MINSFLGVILYYAGGFILAWIAYKAGDTRYAHGPGLREIIVFLTLIIGLVWFFGTIIRYIQTRTAERKIALLAHLLAFAGIAVFIFFL